MCTIGLYADKLIAVSYGLGRHIQYLSPHSISAVSCLSLFATEFYTWSVTFVKISIACVFIRIHPDRLWRLGLYGLIGFEFLMALSCCFMDYFRCRPIRALWDFSISRSHCLDNKDFRKFIYILSGKLSGTTEHFQCGRVDSNRYWH
jgi:hypothetical protein